jgi:large subunit ribosomal protein L32
MAVPRHKHTRAKVGKTRMHKNIKILHLNVCPKCKKPILSHTACLNCGYYKGKEVINTLVKLTKKEQKTRQKEMKVAEKESKKEKATTIEGLSQK